MKRQMILLSAMVLALGILANGCKKDDSSPSGPAAPTNSFSFNLDDGNFAASGPFNSAATSGSGAGWMSSNVLAAYSISSPTNMSVVTMVFLGTPAVRSYTLPSQVALAWMLNVNPNDSASIYAGRCIATQGSVAISAHGSGTSQGTFGGSGAHVLIPTDTCSISNGTFTIYTASAKAAPLPPVVERVARRMMENRVQ